MPKPFDLDALLREVEIGLEATGLSERPPAADDGVRAGPPTPCQTRLW